MRMCARCAELDCRVSRIESSGKGDARGGWASQWATLGQGRRAWVAARCFGPLGPGRLMHRMCWAETARAGRRMNGAGITLTRPTKAGMPAIMELQAHVGMSGEGADWRWTGRRRVRPPPPPLRTEALQQTANEDHRGRQPWFSRLRVLEQWGTWLRGTGRRGG